MAQTLKVEYPGRSILRHRLSSRLRLALARQVGEASVMNSGQGKVAMAVWLRRETAMTLKWVAERLTMGNWSNVSNWLAVTQKKLDER
jgi:hypothetical protein